MTKVPFHFFFFCKVTLASSFFPLLLCGGSLNTHKKEKKKKAEEKSWQKATANCCVVFERRSFDVLECEIPIKWAQTNWFVSDFYSPHLIVGFLSIHFYSSQHKTALSVCIVFCVLCFIFLSLSFSLSLLYFILFASSLSLCFCSRWPWDRVCLYLHDTFSTSIPKHGQWFTVCWIFDADVIPLKLNT